MKEISTLIHNIALGKVLLKFQTIIEVPNTKTWFSGPEYKINGMINFTIEFLQFIDTKNQLQITINYDDIVEIYSEKGVPLGGFLSQPFGTFQPLIVHFKLKDGTNHSMNILTEIYLNEQDLKIEKSPAPSLEKTLETIYTDYKKIDYKRPDFPEYDI